MMIRRPINSNHKRAETELAIKQIIIKKKKKKECMVCKDIEWTGGQGLVTNLIKRRRLERKRERLCH